MKVTDITSTATDCPVGEVAINEYLDLEDYDRQRETLSFFFRAATSHSVLWIWQYADRGHATQYVTILQHQPAARADMVEIGCGPCGREGETAADALDMLARAGVW